MRHRAVVMQQVKMLPAISISKQQDVSRSGTAQCHISVLTKAQRLRFSGIISL
jgi:hypothetical protein